MVETCLPPLSVPFPAPVEPLMKQLVLRPPEGRAGSCLLSHVPWHISLSAVIGGITQEKMLPLFYLSSCVFIVECL